MDQNIKLSPKRIKKKDLILESAVTIFSQHGYNNTKLEQITKSLDLTDKSIYYYFNSKLFVHDYPYFLSSHEHYCSTVIVV